MKLLKRIKSVQAKAIYVCLKGGNVQKAMIYWDTKDTKCQYQKQSTKDKNKNK